jgi:hypothetical protein
MDSIELIKNFGEVKDNHGVSLARHYEGHSKLWMTDCN